MDGILFLHGFTGTRKEIEPLVEYVRRHTDWHVHCPLLPGHGEKPQLRGIRYRDWIAFAEQELQYLLKICDRIFLCGYSMGGLLATYLAVHHSVEKLVLLSPSAYYTNPKNFYKEVTAMFAEGFRGNFRNNDIFQKYKRKILTTPPSAFFQFMRLVKVMRPMAGKVETPTIIIQGRRDPIVPEKSAYYFYRQIRSPKKRLLLLDDADHLICLGRGKEEVFREILHFLTGEEEKIAAKPI